MEPKCFRHKEETGKYYCAKYGRYLCEDCLACQDPTIYCKFRKMCMIWEIIRFGTPEMQEKAAAALKKEKEIGDGEKKEDIKKIPETAKVTFLPGNTVVEVKTGTTLMDAARDNDVYINARCGGKGVCGSCKVKLKSGDLKTKKTTLLNDEDIERGYVLACTSEITGDVKIEIPDENKARALKIVEEGSEIRKKLLGNRAIKPMLTVSSVEIPPPTLDDPSSDLERTRKALKSDGIDVDEQSISLEALSELSADLRSYNWKVSISILDRGYTKEIIRTTPYDRDRKVYGLAVDMGTTSVVGYLVDLSSAEVIGVASSQNRQVVCGEDVISRIICAKGDEGLERLHNYAMKTINDIIEELVTVTKINRRDILTFVLAGNTVMTQSVLKLDPASIRTEPYVPVGVRFPVWQAKDIGLNIHPLAGMYIVPGNAAYVGGDITAGIIASGLNHKDDITLFIDVGTNGEMVLGNKNWMMTASCSAGPAFEGGGIRHGMRALPGAIDDVQIDPATFEPEYIVIDNIPPVGICGSGMIALIGSLFMAGVIDSSSKLNDNLKTDRIRETEHGREYVVAWEKDTGLEEDIYISESEIAILMQSKAAVYGGIMTLLNKAEIPLESINQFLIAGGFGKHIDFEMAIVMGLLPDIDIKKYSYLGNSSIAGAYLALVSQEIREEMVEVSKQMTYIDFSSSNMFYEEYRKAMFLPHTDHRSFPSVFKRIEDFRSGNSAR